MQAARKSTFHGRTLFRAVTLVEKKKKKIAIRATRMVIFLRIIPCILVKILVNYQRLSGTFN
jgi:hypothetical protein